MSNIIFWIIFQLSSRLLFFLKSSYNPSLVPISMCTIWFIYWCLVCFKLGLTQISRTCSESLESMIGCNGKNIQWYLPCQASQESSAGSIFLKSCLHHSMVSCISLSLGKNVSCMTERPVSQLYVCNSFSRQYDTVLVIIVWIWRAVVNTYLLSMSMWRRHLNNFAIAWCNISVRYWQVYWQSWRTMKCLLGPRKSSLPLGSCQPYSGVSLMLRLKME